MQAIIVCYTADLEPSLFKIQSKKCGLAMD